MKSHRLGVYFEALWAFTVRHWLSPDHVIQGLIVRNQGRTLGEFDLLLRHKRRAYWQHLEVSVKFYLGLPVGNGRHRGYWVGLNRNDRLFDKHNKMRDQQLQLSRQNAAHYQLAHHRIQVGKRSGIIQGRLLYPYSQPLNPPAECNLRHLRGWWLTHTERQRLYQPRPQDLFVGPVRLVPLERRQWLAPLSMQEAQQPMSEAQQRVGQDESVNRTEHPMMLARLIQTPNGWCEYDRGVVVADGWPESVIAQAIDVTSTA